jgi:hypothetical protein
VSDQGQVLAKATILGRYELVMWAVPVDSSKPLTSDARWLSEELQEVASDVRLNLTTTDSQELEKLSLNSRIFHKEHRIWAD